MAVFPFLGCKETRDRGDDAVTRRKHRAARAAPAGDHIQGVLSPSIAVRQVRNLLSRPPNRPRFPPRACGGGVPQVIAKLFGGQVGLPEIELIDGTRKKSASKR
jgi:hypothetical protein